MKKQIQNTVSFTVSRDGWTIGKQGLQLAIGDENGGFRLSGPKFNGSGETLLTFFLDSERDIKEIKRYLNKAMRQIRSQSKIEKEETI